MAEILHHPASYKDPSGFIFQWNGKYYRQVNQHFSEDYETLMHSGLYTALIQKKLLIPHTELTENISGAPTCYKTLLPQQLSFISYIYEWGFEQIRDAALLTLSILKISIEHGMILKDATPFNVQFNDGKPVFIDTLSFEKYDEKKPWVAYRQFCECFLFPLYLDHYLQVDIQKILSNYLDGIPVAITAKLLPGKSRFNLGVWLHVFLQNYVKQDAAAEIKKQLNYSRQKLLNLVTHLESIITKLKPATSRASVWDNYYNETILSQDYLEEKKKIFYSFINTIAYNTALDAGANNGYFSKILSQNGAHITAIDYDVKCIDNLYVEIKKDNIKNILPLCIDITNPSAGVGFQNKERLSFADRFRSELVIALAVVHHLVLGKNIPLPDVASFLASLCAQKLIVEFVPVNDTKAQLLIQNKSQYHVYDENQF
ncbi:MAG: SAM-dependent methyltransferase, partial [Bacteroidetes bacterium]|nr:SAM-dependent methyltransferase [Bacteroidota bacterium]